MTRGHEIAGHGYHHEVARDLTREQEDDVMRRTGAMIKQRTGHQPIGWRSCTQSPNSIELLMQHGYLWNSNSFSHDLPFVWESNGKHLIELPRQPFGDGRTYQHRNNDAGNPGDTLHVWKSMFDCFHRESKFGGTYVPFQFHPYISGRPGRAETLQAIIQHMKKAEGTWIATATDVARWCHDEVFKLDASVPDGEGVVTSDDVARAARHLVPMPRRPRRFVASEQENIREGNPMLCRLTCAAVAAFSAMLVAAPPRPRQDVMATWDSIKPLPAPALKPVTLDVAKSALDRDGLRQEDLHDGAPRALRRGTAESDRAPRARLARRACWWSISTTRI